MAEPIDAKTIIDDVRARQAALLQLIYFTDRQATALLRIYVVIGVAGASGAAAGLSGASTLPRALGLAFAAAALVSMIGSALCLRAMAPAQIGFPGREGAFWLFLRSEGHTAEEMLTAYLKRAQAKLELNYPVNDRGAAALERAKWFALAIPLVPLIVGVIAALLKI